MNEVDIVGNSFRIPQCDTEALDIGKFTHSPNGQPQYFTGEISYVRLYEGTVSKEHLFRLYKEGVHPPPKRTALKIRHTVDDRECLSHCLVKPTPGNIGAGDPPKEALLGAGHIDFYGEELEEGLSIDQIP